MEKTTNQPSSNKPFFQKDADTVSKNKNRALSVIQHCNQVLFQAKNEQELLQEVCRIIVEDGGYKFAWIGQPEHTQHKPIKPVASYGFEDGYLDSFSISWDESEQGGRGPAGMAVLTKAPYVVRDINSDPHFAPWRKAAIQRGYAAVAAFPLILNKDLPSVILMYAAEVNAFDDDELELLVHFSNTLRYGIENIRIKEKYKQTEQSIRKSEQLSRSMLDASPIAVRIAKNHGRSIVYCNQSYKNLINTPAEQLLDIDLSNFYEDKSEYKKIIEKVEQGQIVKNQLIKLIIPDDGEKWVMSTYSQIEFEDNQAVLAWFYDITEQKLKDDAFLLSEEEYVKAFKSIPDGLSITTIEDGRFIEVNKGCINLLGYERNELLGHTSIELKLWPDMKHRKKLMLEVEKNGNFNGLEVQFRVKNGDIRDFLISGETISIKQQPCILLSARDITAQNQIQSELRHLRNYLANIINSMPSAVIGVNTEGLVTQWNSEANRITGITTEEAQGKQLADVFLD